MAYTYIVTVAEGRGLSAISPTRARLLMRMRPDTGALHTHPYSAAGNAGF